MWRRLDLQAPLLAGVLALLWLALVPRTPDLAAQSYRVGLFEHFGYLLWDNGWYAGHHVPGYSVIFPALGSLFGMRLVGAVTAVAAAAVFARLADRHFGPHARAGILWFALATASDLAIGRLTYALGAALGLASLLALQRTGAHGGAAFGVPLLAALSAAVTPLAGLFLGLVAGALLLGGRRREAVAVGVPALAVAFALAGLFPEGGREPFGATAFLVCLGLSAAWVWLMPVEQRVLRIAGALFFAAAVLSFVLSTPMGGNISRLGAVFMGPLLLCARPGAYRSPACLLVLAGLLVWQWTAPVREVPKGWGEPLTQASTYTGLKRFLASHHAVRVEIPFTVSHWEAAWVPPRFALARGWEKQLDTRYNALFFHKPLRPAVYHSWLRSLGVRYVALADSPLDPSSKEEGALLRGGLPFLRAVWRDHHWRVWELVDPAPLASGGARLSALHETSFVLRFGAAGAATVLVRHSSFWRADRGACVSRAAGGWTEVRSPVAGLVRVSSTLGGGRSCGA